MAVAVTLVAHDTGAHAATAAPIDVGVNMALRVLYASSAGARALRSKAKAILVFPRVRPAAGGFGGDGALRQGGMTTGYYHTLGGSAPSGVPSFGYALFFLSDAALDSLPKSQDWEIGPGVVLDQAAARRLSTASLPDDIYAFVFNEKGLMTGIGIRGAKITHIHPGE